MTPQWPLPFETIIKSHLKKHYLQKGSLSAPWNPLDTRYFARGVMNLHKAYTEERDQHGGDYFQSPVLRSGYLVYFLPVNMMKTWTILDRYAMDMPLKAEWRIADLGCGPMTLSFAALFHLAARYQQAGKTATVVIEAYELNDRILKDGVSLLKRVQEETALLDGLTVHVKPCAGNILKRKFDKQNFDLVLAGNFLNEIPVREEQSKLIRQILKNFSKKGTRVLLLEPGSKRISRDLQALRDELLERTDHRLLGPCLHMHGCPLNQIKKGDWCHFYQNWSVPPFIEEMDHFIKLKKTWLVYSFMFFENNADRVMAHQPKKFLAITSRIKETHQDTIVGCGSAGRVRVTLPFRDRSVTNQAFDSIQRGDHFEVPSYRAQEHFTLEDKVYLTKGDTIRVVTPYSTHRTPLDESKTSSGPRQGLGPRGSGRTGERTRSTKPKAALGRNKRG